MSLIEPRNLPNSIEVISFPTDGIGIVKKAPSILKWISLLEVRATMQRTYDHLFIRFFYFSFCWPSSWLMITSIVHSSIVSLYLITTLYFILFTWNCKIWHPWGWKKSIENMIIIALRTFSNLIEDFKSNW